MEGFLFGYVVVFIFPFFPAVSFIFELSQSINQSTFIWTAFKSHPKSFWNCFVCTIWGKKNPTWASEMGQWPGKTPLCEETLSRSRLQLAVFCLQSSPRATNNCEWRRILELRVQLWMGWNGREYYSDFLHLVTWVSDGNYLDSL